MTSLGDRGKTLIHTTGRRVRRRSRRNSVY